MLSLSEPQRTQLKVQSLPPDPGRQQRGETGIGDAHRVLLRRDPRGWALGDVSVAVEAAPALAEWLAELIRGRQLAESGPGGPPGGETSGGVRCVPEALPGGPAPAPQRGSQGVLAARHCMAMAAPAHRSSEGGYIIRAH